MSKLLTLYHKYGVLIKIIIFRPWRYTTVSVINEIDLILLLTQAFAVRNTWKFLSKERTGWFASRVRNFWSACCLTLRNSGLNLSSLRRLCFSGRGWKLKVYCNVSITHTLSNINNVTHTCLLTSFIYSQVLDVLGMIPQVFVWARESHCIFGELETGCHQIHFLLSE